MWTLRSQSIIILFKMATNSLRALSQREAAERETGNEVVAAKPRFLEANKTIFFLTPQAAFSAKCLSFSLSFHEHCYQTANIYERIRLRKSSLYGYRFPLSKLSTKRKLFVIINPSKVLKKLRKYRRKV